MNNQPIRNEDTWKEDGFWICSHGHKNEIETTWMGEETCTTCGEVQIFESDYVDAYEGVITSRYLGPSGGRSDD